MPAAANKDDLLTVTRKEWEKLSTLLSDLPEDVAHAVDEDETSLKDVVAHRAHWIELFLGWWADGQAGKEVAFPAPGYKWNELKRYNRDLRERQAGLTWEEARAMLASKHGMLMHFLKARSEAELYGAPMKGANNAWTTGRWAEAAGASHYRSAAKYVRQRKRDVADAGS